jgi:hypothetical protein
MKRGSAINQHQHQQHQQQQQHATPNALPIFPYHNNIRGLEGRLSWGACRKIDHRRSTVLQIFLKEQRYQTQTGIKNDFQIASASSQSSCISRVEAMERALQDARDAGVILQTTNDNDKNDHSYSFVPTSAGVSSSGPQQHQPQGQSPLEKKQKELELELELESPPGDL